MDIISINLTLDLTDRCEQVVYCNQYENNSRQLVCSIQNEGTDYTIPTGATVAVRMTKSTGRGVEKTIGVDSFGSVSGSTITFPLISTMTSANGRSVCDLNIYDTDGSVYTTTFILKVRESALDENAVIDTNDYSTVAEMAASATASATSALEAKEIAVTKAEEASNSATTSTGKAKLSQEYANASSASAVSAQTSATHAATSATNANTSAELASEKASEIETTATLSESYAKGGTSTREGEDTDNSKYYMQQAQLIAEGLSGSLIPMGTIAFADLPTSPTSGQMHNINDEFVTDDRFKEGAGNTIPAGTNVYYTADGYWDCLAGSPVTGVKGENELSYRRGNVNITKSDVGLGNVPNVTTNNQAPTYSTASSNTALSSGESMSTAFGKISKAISSLISHLANTSNPHSVTKEQLGLGNVDNTADINKSVKFAETLPSRAITTLEELNAIASTYAIASVSFNAAITVGTETIPIYAKGTVYGNRSSDASAIFTSVLGGESWSANRLNGTWRANKICYTSGLVDLIYPVGSIYMSVNSTSPAALFGGSWTQLKDKFLLGAGSTYSNGTTGGDASKSFTPSGTVGGHSLTASELPPHTHTQPEAYGNNAGGVTVTSGNGYYYNAAGNTGTGNGLNSSAHTHPFTGTTATINVMPPYLTVYMWKRTA